MSGGPYTTIATDVPWNGFTDTSVVNGTTYYYVVSSVNGAYESADSPETAAQPLGVVPVAPASVSASAGNSVVSVNWSSASYATSYYVKRSTVSGGPYTTIAPGVVGNAFTDTSVLNGTRWNIVQAELIAVAQTERLYFTALYQRGLSARQLTPAVGTRLFEHQVGHLLPPL